MKAKARNGISMHEYKRKLGSAKLIMDAVGHNIGNKLFSLSDHKTSLASHSDFEQLTPLSHSLVIISSCIQGVLKHMSDLYIVHP